MSKNSNEIILEMGEDTDLSSISLDESDEEQTKKVKVRKILVPKKGDDNFINATWVDTPKTRGRKKALNVLKKIGFEKSLIRDMKDKPIEYFFGLFFSDEMLNMIVHSTNIKISKISSEKCTDIVELRAVIGCLIYLGTFNKPPIRDIFKENYLYNSHLLPIRNTFSRERFSFILKNISVGEKLCKESNIVDKANQIRKFEQCFNLISSSLCSPESITIDESLIGFKGRCCFLQYIPSKPDKIGLKVQMAADSHKRFIYCIELYGGRRITEDGEIIQNTGLEIVKRFILNYFSKATGFTICTDSYYTSLNLLYFLKERNIAFIGTIRQNRKEVPQEMKHNAKRTLKSTIVKYLDNDASLTSHMCKTKKTVLILSSEYHDTLPIQGEKPASVKRYNELKSGVDVIDNMVKTHTTRIKTQSWVRAYIFRIIDFAMCNAYSLYKESSHSECSRIEFHRKVGENLMQPIAMTRLSNIYLPKNKLRNIENFVNTDNDGDNNTNEINTTINKRGKCYECQENNEKKRKTIKQCYKCNKNICISHFNIICFSCKNSHNSN
uniref:DDE_Tnp_1_7 domain-containing protein n=1 Tax=Strongyloides papillosus TaxID=174720 RepID=A0A0N5CFK3_STREA